MRVTGIGVVIVKLPRAAPGFAKRNEQISSLSDKESAPFLLVRAYRADFQNDPGHPSYFLVGRSGQHLQPGEVLIINMGLCQKAANLLCFLDMPPLLDGHLHTGFAHMNLVPLARELLVGSRTATDSTVMSHAVFKSAIVSLRSSLAATNQEIYVFSVLVDLTPWLIEMALALEVGTQKGSYYTINSCDSFIPARRAGSSAYVTGD